MRYLVWSKQRACSGLSEYEILPLAACTELESLMKQYFKFVEGAELQWPCQGDSFLAFAGGVFDLMAHIHGACLNGKGLEGGKTMLEMARRKHLGQLRIKGYPAHVGGPAHAGGLISHSAPEKN